MEMTKQLKQCERSHSVFPFGFSFLLIVIMIWTSTWRWSEIKRKWLYLSL